jgi:alpha-tubulin suppressor-like RCC1 family protein
VKQDGTLWAWGEQADNYTAIPVQTGTETHWETVSAGGGHSLAVKQDGTLWVWGEQADGYNIPVQIGTDSNWNTVFPEYTYSLAIKTDGTLWAWGKYIIINSANEKKEQQSAIPLLIDSDPNWNIKSERNDTAQGYRAVKTDGSFLFIGVERRRSPSIRPYRRINFRRNPIRTPPEFEEELPPLLD